jgi:hypothetical protein
MRKRIYVPQRIASMETELAVSTLSDALWKSGVCSQREAKERICRLLGWMCERAEDDGGGREESV